MTGVKAQQTWPDVASVASDLQSRLPKMEDANQHEQLIERQLIKESKWRYRPEAAFPTVQKQPFASPETDRLAGQPPPPPKNSSPTDDGSS